MTEHVNIKLYNSLVNKEKKKMIKRIFEKYFTRKNEGYNKCFTIKREDVKKQESVKIIKKEPQVDTEYLMGRGRFYSIMFNVNNQR